MTLNSCQRCIMNLLLFALVCVCVRVCDFLTQILLLVFVSYMPRSRNRCYNNLVFRRRESMCLCVCVPRRKVSGKARLCDAVCDVRGWRACQMRVITSRAAQLDSSAHMKEGWRYCVAVRSTISLTLQTLFFYTIAVKSGLIWLLAAGEEHSGVQSWRGG